MESDGYGFDTDAEVRDVTFVERLRPEVRNKRMRSDIKRALKWFEESLSDEQAAHWDGWVLPFVHRPFLSNDDAVIKATRQKPTHGV